MGHMFKISIQQNRITTLLVFLLAVLLSACDNPEAEQNKQTVSGSAIKGVISNGIVKAYFNSDEGRQLIDETRTDNFGQFSFEFDKTLVETEIILIELSVDEDTRMRCDLTAGCIDQTNGQQVSFGHTLNLPPEFKLIGLASNQSHANISPLSHLVVTSALNIIPQINNESIKIASRWVNDALQLSDSPLSTQAKDITQFNQYPMMSDEQLKQSILGAAIYPETLSSEWSSGAITIDTINLKDILQRAADLAGNLADIVANSNIGKAATLNRIQSDTEAQLVSLNTSDIVILSQPSATSAIEAQAFSLSVQANSDLQLSYQWYKNNVAIPGATAPVYTKAVSQLSDTGLYSVTISNSQTSLSSLSTLVTINNAPEAFEFTEQPSSLSVTEGEAVLLSVSVSGEGSMSYQWQKNGSLIPGATSRSLFIAESRKQDEGSYRVTVSNGQSQISSNFVNVWVAELIAPVSILSQPQSQTVPEGANAHFSVAVSGGGFIRYQWRKNGLPIQNAFSPSLTIQNATQLDSGSYDVVISNSQGSTQSANATLSVLDTSVPVMIVQQPHSQSVASGSSASFSVSATGDGPIAYQWFLNGSVIPSATSRRYDISAASSDHQGTYSVLVSNKNSSEQSNSASLVVNTPQLTELELSWDTPTFREDGSPLAFDEIAGYVIEYGPLPSSLPNRLNVSNELPHSVTLSDLSAGLLYLRIATVDSENRQSAFSELISVTLP